MKLKQLLSLIAISAIMLIVSLVTSYVYGIGFNASHATKIVLTWIAFILPILFIYTSFFRRLSEKKSLKKLLYPINVLAGIGFYLFLSALILSLLLSIFTAFSIPFTEPVTIICLVISSIFGIMGALQARWIKTTSYTVHLPGAPKEWDGKRAVLVSDTHFGLINHKSFADKVVQKILLLNPDFILHAGDFYDGPKNNLVPITASWKVLTEKIPVFYTPGNHERYGDYDAFIHSIKSADITVLEDMLLEHEGVQIAGIVYRAKGQHAEARTALASLNADPAKALILINHPPTFHESAASIGTNLMVSGHTHRGQFWPNNYITKWIYKQFFYGLQQTQNLTAITTSGVGTAGPPIRLFNTPELVVIHFTTS